MTSVEDLPMHCGPEDEASILRELLQPAHAAGRGRPTRDDTNFTSTDSWCSSAAVSDGRVVAAHADDATGQRVVGAAPSAVVGSAGGQMVATESHGGCPETRVPEGHILRTSQGRGVGL